MYAFQITYRSYVNINVSYAQSRKTRVVRAENEKLAREEFYKLTQAPYKIVSVEQVPSLASPASLLMLNTRPRRKFVA
jgi:hypothetical protein